MVKDKIWLNMNELFFIYRLFGFWDWFHLGIIL